MENNGTGQPWDPTKTPGLGTGEGEVPLAPPPTSKLDARTMSSDSRSMQQSGGAMPRPYAPQSVSSSPAPSPARTPTPPVPVPQMPKPVQAPVTQSSTPIAVAIQKKSRKNIFVISLVAILVIGLGALGYFVLYPMIFGESEVPPPRNDLSPTSDVTPSPMPVPGGEPVPEMEVEPTPQAASLTHISFFKTAADATEDVSLVNLTFPSLKSLISFETADVPLFKELVGRNAAGTILSFGQFVGTLFPSIFSPEVVSQFEPDFTLFSLTNDKGTWLGFVAKKKPNASSQLTEPITALETAPTLSDFFLKPPGTMQTWKTGKAGTVDTRYATFALPGAALNYGWHADHLIVSASYDGIKEALRRLE